jgi:hypothetical protein
MIPTKKELRNLNQIDRIRIILYLLWLHAHLRRPALPAPVNFGFIAALCMFALMPLVPFVPMSIPIVIGGGLSFALLLQGGYKK